jgi:hypothetical protein
LGQYIAVVEDEQSETPVWIVDRKSLNRLLSLPAVAGESFRSYFESWFRIINHILRIMPRSNFRPEYIGLPTKH